MLARTLRQFSPILQSRQSLQKFGVSGSSLKFARMFSIKTDPSFRIQEAVQNFVNLRRTELEEYQGVDEADKQETARLVEVLANSKIDQSTTWSSLGFDGLDEVELLLAVEEALGIKISDDEFHSIHSVADAVNVFSKYLPKQG